MLAYVIEAQYPVLHTPFRYQFATVEDRVSNNRISFGCSLKCV